MKEIHVKDEIAIGDWVMCDAYQCRSEVAKIIGETEDEWILDYENNQELSTGFHAPKSSVWITKTINNGIYLAPERHGDMSLAELEDRARFQLIGWLKRRLRDEHLDERKITFTNKIAEIDGIVRDVRIITYTL